MKIINKKRGSGKTTQIVSAAYVFDCPIIVLNESRKSYITNMAEDLGYPVKVYTLSEFMSNSRGLGIKNVLIDEAEEIMEVALNTLLETNVVAATMTIELK